MNEVLWDAWVDLCNCVFNVLYCILICVFVFRANKTIVYETINPMKLTDVLVIPTQSHNIYFVGNSGSL